MKIPKILVVICCMMPWVFMMFGLAYLAMIRFPLSGTFVVQSDVAGRSAWVNPFLPASRTSSPGVQADGWIGQRIHGDPVYFTSRVPGPYESVDVTLEYRPLRQPLVEFGMVHDAAGTQLELQPFYSSELNASSWSAVHVGAVKGYVKDGTPPSRVVDANPSGMAVWDASSTSPLFSDPSGPLVATDVSLRGSHEFYLVPSGDRVQMRLTLQAANRKTGSDVAVLRVFRGDEVIHQEVFGANGSQDKRMGQVFTHELNISPAAPGVYRISFTADDDVFIRKIETSSKRWVLGSRIYVGDVVGYATSSFPGQALTDSRHIVVETFHPEGIQTVTLGAQAARVQKTHEVVRLDRVDLDPSPAMMRAPHGDIRIVGDGFFALRPETYFQPLPRRFTDATRLAAEGISAVITPYMRPQTLEDGWYRSTARFGISPTLDTLRFVLSTPGMASRSGAIDIRRIELTYHRAPLTLSNWWHILKQELANAWRRL